MTTRTRPPLIGALVVFFSASMLFSTCGAAAFAASHAQLTSSAAGPVTLQPSTLRQLMQAPNQRGDQAAYRECGPSEFHHTSAEPAATFEVGTAMHVQVLIRILGYVDVAGALLEGPGGPACLPMPPSSRVAVLERDLAPGQYAVHVIMRDKGRAAGKGWGPYLSPTAVAIELLGTPSGAPSAPMPHVALTAGSRETTTLQPADRKAILHPSQRNRSLPGACSGLEFLHVAREPSVTFELSTPTRTRVVVRGDRSLYAAILETPGVPARCLPGRGQVRFEDDLRAGHYALTLILYDATQPGGRGFVPRFNPGEFSIALTELSPAKSILEDAFVTNPRVIEGLRATAPGRSGALGATCAGDAGGGDELVLDNRAHIDELHLSPTGNVRGLAVIDGVGRVHCDQTVILRDVAPGPLRIRAIGARTERFAVTIVDPARGPAGEGLLHVELKKRLGRAGASRREPPSAAAFTERFLAAPEPLFVYAAADLRRESAYRTGPEPDGPVAYPRKDERLLVLQVQHKKVRVATADWSMFHINAAHLRLLPQGVAVLPASVRNFNFSWTDAKDSATGKDRAAVDRYLADERVADACAERFWNRHHGGTDRKLLRVTYVNGRVSRVENYTALMRKMLLRSCGLSRLSKRFDKLLLRLQKSERDRRTADLQRIRERFANH